MFGNNAPDGAEILALLGMRPTTKHAPTLARPKIKFTKPRFVPTGSISAPDPSIRNSIQQTLAGVLSKAINERQAHRLASRAMAPLTDATPLGNVTGAEEGGKQFYRGLTRGDARTAGLGALSFGLSVLPLPGGVKKAARKTGLFGSLMKDEAGAIRAWHGSPHDFDRFDISKIGTGEGAQAYGHGLYFAENKDVAREYRDTLAHKAIDRSFITDRAGIPLTEEQAGMVYRNLLEGADPVQSALRMQSQFRDLRDEGASLFPYAPAGGSKGAALIKLHEQGLPKAKGRLYEVNINAEPEDFLDYDAPIADQPLAMEVLRNLDLDQTGALSRTKSMLRFVKEGRELPEYRTKGRELLNAVSGYGENRNLEHAALMPYGIKGVRYLDQGSRGAGSGSRNFVVFDDKLVNILGKY